MISRRPPHGSSSSADSGVWPNSSRYGFDGFFFRFRTRPPSMTTSLSYFRPSTSMDPNRSSRACMPSPPGRSSAVVPAYRSRVRGRSDRTRLVLGSALMLFLELALIRWTGANIVHLSFFSNFVLLGSFLGIGLGFLLAREDRPARPYYSLVALLALVGFILSNPVIIDRASADVIFFTSLQTTGPKPWLSLSLIFIAVAVIMAGPGEIVGSCFHHLPRLEAYRLDLIGSLAGIVAF